MEIPREIRKKLERSLSQDVLDFLTEKFMEAEKYCEEAKILRRENEFLKQQIIQQDSMMRQVLQGQQQNQQSMGYQQIQQPQRGPQYRHIPWEYPWEEDYPEYRRGKDRRGSTSEAEFRRGRQTRSGVLFPGTDFEARRRTRNEADYYPDTEMRRGVPGSGDEARRGRDRSDSRIYTPAEEDRRDDDDNDVTDTTYIPIPEIIPYRTYPIRGNDALTRDNEG